MMTNYKRRAPNDSLLQLNQGFMYEKLHKNSLFEQTKLRASKYRQYWSFEWAKLFQQDARESMSVV